MGTSTQRYRRRKRGDAIYRLVRYADDFVVMVAGTREHAVALSDEAAVVLSPMGLRLSEEKTQIAHIDEGFDFLGFRIQRRRKRGTDQRQVYTYPSRKALAAVRDKVRTLTRREANPTFEVLLHRLNAVLRGWCNYFKHGVSKRTFSYLDHFAWHRVTQWLRKRHTGLSWTVVRHRHLQGWRPTTDGVTLFDPKTVTVSRYRYRADNIPTPWTSPITTVA